MLPIIHATRKGISSLVRNKVSSVYLIVALIVLCVWLPEGCILAQQLPFTIAAQSLPSLLNVPYDISLCEFWLAMMSYRLMLALDIVSLAMMISVFLHSAYQSLFIIEAAILLPNAVAIVFPVLRIPLLFVSAISSHEWYLAFMPVLATTITLVCLANMVIPIALKRKL